MKNKRIFISGGSGVIGKELVEKLLSEGAQLFIGDLKPCPPEWVGKVQYRMGDLVKMAKEELLEFQPEIVFHLAATFERSVESYPFFEENFHHNVLLSHHLMEIFKDLPSLKQVVFASSYLIYNPEQYLFKKPEKTAVALKETSAVYPRNICGGAKFFHELELRFLEEFKGITCALARIFRVYGKDSNDVISRWVRALLKDEKIHVYNPEGIFDYIYAGDVAEGLLRISKASYSGIVNLGSGQGRSIENVLAILKKHFPKMKMTQEESKELYEASTANIARLEKTLSWTPSETLESGISKIIEHEKKGKRGGEETFGILVTSISKKIPLLMAVRQAAQKIGRAFKLYGADLNSEVMGKYFVDEFWKSPETLSLEAVAAYCAEKKIGAIIPTRDGELLFFAQNKEKLKKLGIEVMVSDVKSVQIVLDKLLFSQFLLKNNLPAIPTSSVIDDLECRTFVVKEQRGAGSYKIGINLTNIEAKRHAKGLVNPIFQPYLIGVEYSVDLYRDKNGMIKGCIARTRDVVVNGESQVTTTKKIPKLEALASDLADQLNLYGHAVIQAIESADGFFHLLECNPRFGGASTASIACNLDSFYWFLLEALGENIEKFHYHHPANEIRMIRYPKDLVLPW